MKLIDRLGIKTLIGLGLAAAVFVCASAAGPAQTAFEEKAFIAGADNTVQTYQMDEHGQFQKAARIPRGTQVMLMEGAPGEPADGEFRRIYLKEEKTAQKKTAGLPDFGLKDAETTETPESGARYVHPENLVKHRSEAVQEKELYVRTPVTIYENSDGPKIAGFASKGTKLEVTGFAGLDENGAVDKYKVRQAETDSAPEGFAYGKYLVRTQEEADAVYNENGEYDKAKKARYGINLHGGKAEDLDYYPYERTQIEGKPFCREAKAMYLNYYAALHNDAYIKLIKETGCNAVVIDIKDGALSYQSPAAEALSPTAYKKAHVSLDEFREAVKEFQEEGIYTIGRITCFNDRYYAKDHPEDCIRSESAGAGWPSAYSRDVWYYNVALATEAVELMDFDEIQFDYVRFPERAYELSLEKGTRFRNNYGESKAQAIQNFCFYAADQIHEAGAYFSVDVFGECSDGYVTAYGQYWPAISNIVDAISSMPYTDHFGDEDTWSHPKAVMSAWAKKAAKEQTKIPTPAAARTWITGYNTPFWAPSVTYDKQKLKEQVDALYKAGLDGGFIPWNSASSIEQYRMYKGIWDYEK